MYKSLFLKVAFLLIIIVLSQSVNAQDILKGKDLSQIKVDQLTDADIAKLKAQLAGSNLTIDQAEQMAISKGMSAAEFAKLKQRLAATTTTNNSATGKLKSQEKETVDKQSRKDSLSVPPYDRTKPKPLIDSLIFGSELYTSVAPSFEPNMSLATPMNYVLGPNDVLSVSVYGVQVYDGELPVSAEGFVNVPNVGQIKVAGMTIELATQRMKTAMSRVYSTLSSGGSKLAVTLSKIRSIKVNVIGSVFPGTYTVSSLSSVFNVLYLAGGPRQFGTFREIELVRANQPVRKIDLYRFLANGDQSDNIGLKDNDVIRIPAYKTRVELQGQVKRPGIFEVLPGENFSDILAFASGFTDTAYMASVKVYQRNDRERTVKDLARDNYQAFTPQTGDVIVASRILNRFQNRVKITGAIFRPDIYELTNGLKVADLIRRADGLKGDAFIGRGQILRQEDDLSRSILSFDIAKALAGNETSNLLLKREDEVLISSVQDLKDSLKVNVQGEVRRPGTYDYVDKLTLKDVLLQAGGFTDAAYKKVEVARMLRRDSIGAQDNRMSTVIDVELSDLNSLTASLTLQPFDVITVRRMPGYVLPESIIVIGQVQYPGPYALQSTDERISQILKRVGGFTPDAYIEGAYVKRYKTDLEKAKSEEVAKKAEKNILDTAGLKSITEDIKRDYDKIPLDIHAILKSPGSFQDFVLRSKDELVIPKFDAQVRISGEVLMTTQVTYQKTSSFNDYISSAGGYSMNAKKSKSYIVYSNGRAASIKRFLFFKSYPKVLPGSEIIIPKKPEKKPLSSGEIIGIASALASLAGVVIAILNL
jgi:protein involved in polysaccharide export with SLBB domain